MILLQDGYHSIPKENSTHMPEMCVRNEHWSCGAALFFEDRVPWG